MQYNIHKERKDSTRFAKGTSETFTTIKNLVNKGVKVELGIPEKMWDDPSAEITELKRQCELLLERYEDDIEEWYNDRQDEIPLIDFLCRDKVLKKKDTECLYEVVKPKSGIESKNKAKKISENVKIKNENKKQEL